MKYVRLPVKERGRERDKRRDEQETMIVIVWDSVRNASRRGRKQGND